MYIKIKERHHVLMNAHIQFFMKMEITVNFGKNNLKPLRDFGVKN